MKSLIVRLFVALILITSHLAYAQSQVSGQGRFNSVSEDSLSFVRGQLLYRAFRDVLNKELSAMGLNAQDFWEKYNERFNDSFESVEKELRKSYELDSDEPVSERERKKFNQELRKKRLAAQARFGNLGRAIESYSIRDMSRSAQAAQSRYLNLDANVNRRMLNSIYSEFMQEGQPRFYSQLYMTTDFSLKEGSWSDLGVGSQVDFTQVVEKHWKNWLKNKLSRSVQDTVVTDEAQLERIQEFLKTPLETTQALMMEGHREEVKDDRFVEGEEVKTQRLDTSLSNSLWLKLEIQLTKTSEDPLLNERSFEYSGNLLLIDLKTRDVLLSHNINSEEHKYQTGDRQALSSTIASFVYRMPMGGLEKLPRLLLEVDSRAQSIVILVNNLSSISDLYTFNEMLANEGLTEEFDPQLLSFDGLNARVQLNFKGEGSQALSRLRKLHMRDLNDKTTAIVESMERPFEFRLEHRMNHVNSKSHMNVNSTSP